MNQLLNYKKWMEAIKNFGKSDYKTWFKFAMLWFSFNSYYSDRYSHIRGEGNQLIEFAKDNKSLYESLLSDEQANFKNVLDKFAKTKSPSRDGVKDMRQGSSKYVKFDSKHKSSEDFFKVLYQIRCNFFHGDKLPFFKEDKKLIHWAFKYFKIFWERFLERNEN
jgi:hypothetical protein